MKTRLLLPMLLFAGANTLAQVGIGTTAPKAVLDIPATNTAAPANTDGILVPRIDAFPAVNPTADQNGMMVFLTNDLPSKPKGFYYWDNPTNSWIGIGADAKGWELTGNSGTNPLTNFMGTTDDKDIIFKRFNVRAGQLSVQNTAFGVNTLNPLNTGIFNTAFGTLTLTANTTGTQNTAMGDGALQINTTGYYNSAIGSNALYGNTGGFYNSAFGTQTLELNADGTYNSAYGNFSLRKNTGHFNSGFGVNSLVNNTVGYENVGVGVNAGYTNQTGYRNVAIGNNALYYNTAWGNVGVGHQAAAGNTTGQYNTAIGTYSLLDNQIGSYNTATGFNALIHNKSDFNTATGVNALFTNTTGNYNTASGVESLFLNNSGTLNTASGYRALRNNATGTANTAFGENALATNTASNYNVAIGGSALLMNTGAENVAVGTSALRLNDVGYNSTAIGVNALYNNKSPDMLAVGNRALSANTTGLFNTALGTYAMQNSKEASHNTAVGYGALNKNNDGTPAGGSWNVAMGNYTLLQNTTGHSNVSVGFSSMYKNTTGTWNVCVGGATLYENTIGYNNTAVGYSALYNNVDGYFNTALGLNTLYKIQSGNDNTGIGYQSLYNIETGINNTAIGAWSMYGQTAGSGNIAIGRNVNTVVLTGSNQLNIGNSIYGTDINNAATAKIGIGMVPTEKLDVNGKTRTTNLQVTNGAAAGRVLVSDATGNATWQNSGSADAAWYETATTTPPDLNSDSMYHTGNTAIGVNNPGTTKLYVYNQQLTANGDGQQTVFGYRTRDTQNDGSGYGLSTSNRAIGGYNFFGDAYTFGTTGHCDNDFNRSGGILGGHSGGVYWASLGYRASSGNFYGVYGTSTTTGTGRMAQQNTESSIGGGFYGGAIGSWSKGNAIGQISSGNLFASYNSGDEYTAGKQIELVDTGNAKTAAYTVTSTESVIYKKGKITLQNGSARIDFDVNYRNLLGDVPVVTVSPMGQCNGLYIESVDKNGFTVKELGNGTSNVSVSWIAVGDRIDASANVQKDVLDKDFDANLNDAMFNENNTQQNGKGVWTQGSRIHFGQLAQPQNPSKKEILK
ncbi:beta strand repeat-containing protein [Flavobacterium sp.]|uniref:beta strand repeat-containing protein n=1 Tax=Flavobacterium sp. TaxID=239 RepID=UPI0039E46182